MTGRGAQLERLCISHLRTSFPLCGNRDGPSGRQTLSASVIRAGVTQLAECLLPKQNVAGSNPVSRSTSPQTAGRDALLRAWDFHHGRLRPGRQVAASTTTHILYHSPLLILPSIGSRLAESFCS